MRRVQYKKQDTYIFTKGGFIMHCEICGGQIEIQANGKGICPYCEGRLSIFGKKCKSCGKSY